MKTPFVAKEAPAEALTEAQILSRDSRDYQSFLHTLTPLERFALKSTERVGSVAFFLALFVWTVLWGGYNILATEFPKLHWPSFDPFPSLAIYSILGNIIQILLLPLILLGQTLDSRRMEQTARRDFEINQQAEKEIRILEAEVSHLVTLAESLAQKQGCPIPPRVQSLKQKEEKTASCPGD